MAADHDRNDHGRGWLPVSGARGAALDPFRFDRTYAALDLGTNNCRLLIARPAPDGFRVVDSFSRIVRLGEGLTQTGRLGEAAIGRTLDALEVCREKLMARQVARTRLIATEACRAAHNGPQFIERVASETGLQLEIVDRRTEAGLATAGCAALADSEAASVLLFDIGGGSSEVIWLTREDPGSPDAAADRECRLTAWTSLRLGVVTLAETFGGKTVTKAIFEAMVAHVMSELREFAAQVHSERRCSRFHLLGTSGTVTTLAGVHLKLPRYDRRRIDGLWMSREEVDDAIANLRAMSFDARIRHGCIGPDRADLVLAGCAIFEAIRKVFPCERVRIADRGLREGLLLQMMRDDGVWNRAGQSEHHQ